MSDAQVFWFHYLARIACSLSLDLSFKSSTGVLFRHSSVLSLRWGGVMEEEGGGGGAAEGWMSFSVPGAGRRGLMDGSLRIGMKWQTDGELWVWGGVVKNMERPRIEVEREGGRRGWGGFGCLTTPADRCCLYERQVSTLHILSLSLTPCVWVL